MASSDEEVDVLPESVSDYNFVDENDEPISFSDLPIKWSHDAIGQGRKKKIFISGTVDNGLRKIFEPVTAWKFDLSGVEPVISVLWRDNNWIKLQKSRKSFECIIRSILVTVNCLYFVKKNPEASGKLLWDQLSKIFSVFEVRPSENDLIDHIQLIEETFKRDESLAKSKFLATFLEKRPQKKKATNEDNLKPQFTVDDEYICDEEEELFDSVCAICDNGGNITPCDGICMRSFHATPEDAISSDDENGEEEVGAPCASLGLTKSELAATPYFHCKNCLYKQHQCFSCGKLGSSDKQSGAAEVFQCTSATCGFFYHPVCVAKLLHPDSEADAEELVKNVALGGPFTCPSHRCHVCKQMENAADPDLQFAVCRRCPKSYHRKCLPRRISFEEAEKAEQRAWEELLPNNRILIYCLKHKIDPELGTPARNHIKFPGEVDEKKTVSEAQLLIKDKVAFKKKRLVPGAKVQEWKSDKQIDKLSLTEKEDQLDEKNGKKPVAVNLKKVRIADAPRSTLFKRKPVMKKTERFSIGKKGKVSLGEHSFVQFAKQSDSAKPSTFASEIELRRTVKTDFKQSESSVYELDADSLSRIDDLMKVAESTITSKGIYEKYNKLASTHAHSQKTFLETITLGKVEGFRQAIEVASRKLDEGGNIEEAMAVCGPSVLNQIIKWKHKLKVCISPFLHGMRYTSFGRHFTKMDKLKEIVDMIHWYVDDGDTVVDFCCGANDFSCLMKEKLEQTGKKCFYRNFDLFRPKNDFAFEKRDFMSVDPSELPKRSKLIMGLNPPFGVKAALANKFINKALEFKPKLMVLIVPREIQRLDEKNPPYDLVWEDFEKLSGKSFYLPGSIDVNDKQMDDWNVVSPVLYLWSHTDFTSKHREIAEKYGHLSGKKGLLESHSTESVPNHLPQDNAQVADMEIDVVPALDTKLEEFKTRSPVDPEDPKEKPVQSNITKEEIHATNVSESSSSSLGSEKKFKKKRQREEKLPAKVNSNILPGEDHANNDNKSGRRPSLELCSGKRRNPSSNRTSYRYSSPLVHNSQRNQGSTPPICDEDMGYARGHHPQSDPDVLYGSGYTTPPGPGFVDNSIPKRFVLENEGPYLSGRRSLQLVPQYRFDDPQPNSYTREIKSYNYLRAYNSETDGGFEGLNPTRGLPYGGGSRMPMPAMQRYAPRLDEMNYARRMGSVGPNPSVPGGNGGGVGGGIYDYRPALRPAYQGVPMGFAPGARHSYPHRGLGGWIGE